MRPSGRQLGEDVLAVAREAVRLSTDGGTAEDWEAHFARKRRVLADLDARDMARGDTP